MPFIPVNKVVYKKIIIGKIEGRGEGGEALGVTAPPPKKKYLSIDTVSGQ
jgi:hypothetical protein